MTDYLFPKLEYPDLIEQNQIKQAYLTDDITPRQGRIDLEYKYAALLTPTDLFNRKLVSYQANKKKRIHNWLKYKEGFSADLVKELLVQFGIRQNQKILDPFAGVGTTLLVAKELGIDAVGIELLPVCHLAWEAKSHYQDYDTEELKRVFNWLKQELPGKSPESFPHLNITRSAFPAEQESILMWYKQKFEDFPVSPQTHVLLQLVIMSVLESVSYTRKDGQYLRWDYRANKAQERDLRRANQGKTPYKQFNKGKILDVKDALMGALGSVLTDILQSQVIEIPNSDQEILKGSVLEILPRIANDQFDAVITSPPYCNRYDYTRTYALELAYLGSSEKDVNNFRQELLSCTVENRSKNQVLEEFYSSIGRIEDYHTVLNALETNSALQEVFHSLHIRGERNELNNKGVIRMVEGYFTELAFVIYELYRTSKPGAHVAVVNDNVRYGGEIIPVDLLMTDLATSFGFKPIKVYVLSQYKGNSSQQMGRYGREAMRKSITIWQK